MRSRASLYAASRSSNVISLLALPLLRRFVATPSAPELEPSPSPLAKASPAIEPAEDEF